MIGAASLVPYACALGLKNLLLNIVPFEWIFFAAFGLYGLAAWWVLQHQAGPARRTIVLIFAFAILFRATLVFSQPSLSTDMYRYVWDGRVQAHGINPYVYPPAAAQVAGLRDQYHLAADRLENLSHHLPGRGRAGFRGSLAHLAG